MRPGELRKASWDEINFTTAEWRIPAARIKIREVHIVPLSRQAIGILRELEPLTGSDIRPSRRMMQAWADYLDVLRETRNVISGHVKRAG